MTLTSESPSWTLHDPMTNDLPFLDSYRQGAPRASIPRACGVPSCRTGARCIQGEEQRQHFKLCSQIFLQRCGIGSLCLFNNGSYLSVRAVFRTIITLYKRLAGFLPTCSAAPEWHSKFNRRPSSWESLLRGSGPPNAVIFPSLC